MISAPSQPLGGLVLTYHFIAATNSGDVLRDLFDRSFRTNGGRHDSTQRHLSKPWHNLFSGM
jgi:hypothetical protein